MEVLSSRFWIGWASCQYPRVMGQRMYPAVLCAELRADGASRKNVKWLEIWKSIHASSGSFASVFFDCGLS